MAIYHSVNHLVYERTTQQPDSIALGVPDKALKYTKYTYKELDVAASLLAKHYVDSHLLVCRATGDNSSHLVVGFLSQSNFDYVVNELALLRLGYCILLISPNNSPAAVAHLLEQSRAESIIASEVLMNLVESAVSNAPFDSGSLKIIRQPSAEVYCATARKSSWDIFWKYPLAFEQESELPSIIIHSSGSTGHPKPISITHRAGIANYAQHFGYRNFTTLPLYHNHGNSNLYRAIHAGQPYYLFPAGIIPITASNILSLLRNPDCDAECVSTVPLILKFLAEDDEGVEILRRMKIVMFGGSALSSETGDKLVAAGVKLIGQMGTTETGQIGTSIRDFDNDKEWNYIRPTKHLYKFFRFDDQGDGTYELVVLDGYPSKVMSNQPDGSFRTKDLYMMHPTLDFAFKFCGRLDDTLVMVNGEKTNPVPMELSLRGESPYISDAVVFGTGRTQVGALILPTELGKDKDPDELRSLIAPALAVANADAPTHSQLAPETLIFLPYGTLIPRADKGSPIRARTYAAFNTLIDDMYRRLEGDIDGGNVKMRITSLDEAKAQVLRIILETLGDKVEGLNDNTDLFALGLDSLQATRIRNAIQRGIDIGSHKLSSNFVFEHPSIQEIAKYLFYLNSGHTKLSASNQTEMMLRIIEKYRTFAHDVQRPVETIASRGQRGGKCLVLTGVTGSLGAYLLNEFLADSAVSRVYCLARAPSHEVAEERVTQSMASRGLARQFQAQRQRVFCYSADFVKKNLGLSPNEYEQLRREVTLIIHSAWPVNFNLGITSFEPHIAGAVNLMRLALEASRPEPAEFYFCSSVSAVFAWPGPGGVPEEITSEPNCTQQTGYARSKWVVEKLCQIASNTSLLHARVLRIGQLVGDSRNGIWNESEAVSLMIRSAQVLSILPDLNESPAWLPVDAAARVIYEVVSIPNGGVKSDSLCWHIVQPRCVPWSDILDYLDTAGLTFKRVPPRQWLDCLRKSDPDPIRNPTIKLLEFFEKKYGHENDGFPKSFALITKKTEASSPTLRTAPYPDKDLVKKWISSWRRTGFLQ